jgi:hypothetical protein
VSEARYGSRDLGERTLAQPRISILNPLFEQGFTFRRVIPPAVA